MIRSGLSDFAIYRGDEVIVIGSKEECAAFMGWNNKNKIYRFTAPSYRKRLEKRNSKGAIYAIKLEDDE